MNFLSLTFRIIAILSAGIAGTLYFLTADKIEEKDKEIARVRSELQTLIDKNENMSLEVSEFQEKLLENTKLTEEAQIKVEEAKAELIAEMQENQRLQNKIIDTQRQISRLEETTNRLREELLNAENESANASQEGVIAQLSDRIEELMRENEKLKDEISTLKGPTGDIASNADLDSTNVVELTPFSVRTLTLDEANAIKDKTSVASLSAENGIIVLNAGPKLNFNPGLVVELVKGLEVIARVKVINTKDSLAIANILPGAKLDGLSKGDTVKILR